MTARGRGHDPVRRLSVDGAHGPRVPRLGLSSASLQNGRVRAVDVSPELIFSFCAGCRPVRPTRPGWFIGQDLTWRLLLELGWDVPGRRSSAP
jgi:hypothetical protein